MKSPLRLFALTCTISSPVPWSSTPSSARLHVWPGAGTRRSVPRLAQACARYGWVNTSDSSAEQENDVAGFGLLAQETQPQPRPVDGLGILPPAQAMAGTPPTEPPFMEWPAPLLH